MASGMRSLEFNCLGCSAVQPWAAGGQTTVVLFGLRQSVVPALGAVNSSICARIHLRVVDSGNQGDAPDGISNQRGQKKVSDGLAG